MKQPRAFFPPKKMRCKLLCSRIDETANVGRLHGAFGNELEARGEAFMRVGGAFSWKLQFRTWVATNVRCYKCESNH
jgi:hypothetical protein